jgi:hypothetical protein
MTRKSFEILPISENPQFLEDATQIYTLLRNKYPTLSVVDLDNILNALCFSLSLMMKLHVEKDNRESFIQLIYKILSKNIDAIEVEMEEKDGST